MGALATIAFAYTTVITPEIQATVRNPPVQEFYKALAVTYGIGAPVFLIMSLVGWWCAPALRLTPLKEPRLFRAAERRAGAALPFRAESQVWRLAGPTATPWTPT